MVKPLEQLFSVPQNIRIVSLIGHFQHGKSTLADSLLAKGGLIDPDEQPGLKRATHTLEEEVERGISITSTAVSMALQLGSEEKGEDVVLLIDTPGHTDFNAEVTAALSVSDGAIVVIDCVQGVCMQTAAVLRQALDAGVKPFLVINKVDKAVVDLQWSPEDAYTTR